MLVPKQKKRKEKREQGKREKRKLSSLSVLQSSKERSIPSRSKQEVYVD